MADRFMVVYFDAQYEISEEEYKTCLRDWQRHHMSQLKDRTILTDKFIRVEKVAGIQEPQKRVSIGTRKKTIQEIVTSEWKFRRLKREVYMKLSKRKHMVKVTADSVKAW